MLFSSNTTTLHCAASFFQKISEVFSQKSLHNVHSSFSSLYGLELFLQISSNNTFFSGDSDNDSSSFDDGSAGHSNLKLSEIYQIFTPHKHQTTNIPSEYKVALILTIRTYTTYTTSMHMQYIGRINTFYNTRPK